jgi:hypothetical protein
MQRPLGVTVSTILMYLFAFVGLFGATSRGSHPHRFIAFVIALLVIELLVLYQFWLGQNWARWLVLLDCLIQFLNLWNEHRWHVMHPGIYISPIRLPLILCKVALAVFLLVYLNTRKVRDWFIDRSRDAQDTPAPHSPPAAPAAPHTGP